MIRGIGDMRAFLREIHANPDDRERKLAYADWYCMFDDPRGGLIRARETLRVVPDDPEAKEWAPFWAAKALGTKPKWEKVISRLVQILEERIIRTWEADCAERVLGIFERECADDRRPRSALEACRAFVSLKLGFQELHAVASEALAAANAVDEPAHSAAMASVSAAWYGIPNVVGAGRAAVMAVSFVAGGARGQAEERWQEGRLLDLWLYGWDYPLSVSERTAIGEDA